MYGRLGKHKLNDIRCIFSELLCGKPPFRGSQESDQIQAIFEKCGTPNEEIWPGVSKLPLYDNFINGKKSVEWNLKKYYLDNKS